MARIIAFARRYALTVTLLLTAAAAGASAYAVIQGSRTNDQVAINQRANTAALCSLKSDLQKRVDAGKQFLITHPKGIAGIPAATLRSSIENQQHTLTALAPLICPNT